MSALLTSDDVDGAMVSVKYIDLQREENVLEDGEQCSGLADKCTRHSILTLDVNVQQLLVLAPRVTLAAYRNCSDRGRYPWLQRSAPHKLIMTTSQRSRGQL